MVCRQPTQSTTMVVSNIFTELQTSFKYGFSHIYLGFIGHFSDH